MKTEKRVKSAEREICFPADERERETGEIAK